MPSIAVIIVTYNALPWAEKCFLPLRSSCLGKNVYIIDNGSIDGTQDFIRNKCPEFTFVQSDINLGFGKGNNLGLELALKDGCTHFLLLNQDAQITWKRIEQLVKIQTKNTHYGVLSPIHLNTNSAVDGKHLKTLMKRANEYINDLIAGNQLEEVYEIGYTNAAIWLVSKECLRKTGGFDPLFPHYGEDSEYAERANFFGFKIGLCPHVKGYHFREQNKNSTRQRTSTFYFITFLYKAKKLNTNLGSVYIHLLKQLITTTIVSVVGLQNFAFKNQWLAFCKLLKLRNHILKHRRWSIDNEYSFLRYEDE